MSARHRDNTLTSCPLPWIAREIARLGASARTRDGATIAGLAGSLVLRLRALDRPNADAEATSIVLGRLGLGLKAGAG